MTNPEVQHGKQPAVNPEVAVNGPLGETTVNVGAEFTPVEPEPETATEDAPEPAEPETDADAEPDAEPETD